VTNLLLNRAEVNCLGNKGLSPLHIAAAVGNSDIVAILFQNGADVCSLDEDGNSPLHLADYYGNSDTVTILRQYPYGADVNCHNLDKAFPLHNATLATVLL
jgi:ankyrin repeat protein